MAGEYSKERKLCQQRNKLSKTKQVGWLGFALSHHNTQHWSFHTHACAELPTPDLFFLSFLSQNPYFSEKCLSFCFRESN